MSRFVANRPVAVVGDRFSIIVSTTRVLGFRRQTVRRFFVLDRKFHVEVGMFDSMKEAVAHCDHWLNGVTNERG